MNKTAFWQQGRRLARFYDDREYFRRLVRIALPIALQQLIMSSLNMVSVLLIGQLGEAPVAAVGLANQVHFLLNLLLFGISSGSAMFTAQLWGKGDIFNIRRVLSLSIFLSLAGGLLFFVISLLSPDGVLSIYSEDLEVIRLGSMYLRLYGWAFLFMPVTFSLAAVLRSIGDVKTPLVISLVALSLNALLSYGLVLGNLGFPALGVQGAAIAAMIARVLECTALVFITYLRRSPAAVPLREMFTVDLSFAKKVIIPVLPVVLNEMLWSLGITTYNVVYARIGTDSIAAMNIVSTIDNLALVIFLGIAHATSILVGNWIGAGDNLQAFRYAGRSLSLSALGALGIGALIHWTAPAVLGLYKVSPEVIEAARNILLIISLLLWLRVSNLILFIGIFRSGGDTKIAFLMDAGMIWMVGVPLALVAAFVLHLPIHWVYLFVMTEELCKWAIGMARFFSKKWIHNLAQTV